MISLYAVLTTKYLRRLRFYWLMFVLLFIGGPLAFVGLLRLRGLELSPDALQPYDFYAAYMALALLILPLITLLIQWEIYPHLYTRPISTRAMAAWLIVMGVATTVGTNLLFLLAYRGLFGATWPILTPTLFFIAFTLLAQCINWNLLKPTFFKSLGGMAAIAGAAWWFAGRHYPNGFTKAMEPWRIPSAEELGVMLTASVVATLLGLYGLSKARHESDGNIDPTKTYDLADPYVSSRVPRLAEVPRALNWFFWQRGMPYAVGAAGMVTLCLGLFFVFARKEMLQAGDVLEGLAGMSFFISMLVCLPVGAALGMDIRHPVRHILMPFLSTRPVTTEQLSRSLLWNAFKSVLAIWSILIVALVLYGTEFFLKISPAELLAKLRATELGIAAIPLTLIGSFLVGWIGLSWMAVLGWSGREKILIGGTFSVIGLPIFYMLTIQFLVPKGWVNFLQDVGLWLPAVVIPLMTVDLTVAARRGAILSKETQYLLVALAACLIAFFGILLPLPTSQKVLICLYSMASLLPIPAAPLMLEWNRHR